MNRFTRLLLLLGTITIATSCTPDATSTASLSPTPLCMDDFACVQTCDDQFMSYDECWAEVHEGSTYALFSDAQLVQICNDWSVNYRTCIGESL